MHAYRNLLLIILNLLILLEFCSNNKAFRLPLNSYLLETHFDLRPVSPVAVGGGGEQEDIEEDRYSLEETEAEHDEREDHEHVEQPPPACSDSDEGSDDGTYSNGGFV